MGLSQYKLISILGFLLATNIRVPNVNAEDIKWGSQAFTANVLVKRFQKAELQARLNYDFTAKKMQYAMLPDTVFKTIEYFSYDIENIAYKMCPDKCRNMTIGNRYPDMPVLYGDSSWWPLDGTNCDQEFGHVEDCTLWTTKNDQLRYVAQVVDLFPVRISIYDSEKWIEDITFINWLSKVDTQEHLLEELEMCKVEISQDITDVCFILDGSGSIYEEQFQKSKKSIAEWLGSSCDMVQGKCYIDQNSLLRVGIVQIGTFSQLVSGLDNTVENTISELGHLSKSGGLTDIGAGFSQCLEEFERAGSFAQSNMSVARKSIIVLFSDGVYTQHRLLHQDTASHSKTIQENGVSIYGVSVYDDAMPFMTELVSSPLASHIVDWELSTIRENILKSFNKFSCRERDCVAGYCSCGGCFCPPGAGCVILSPADGGRDDHIDHTKPNTTENNPLKASMIFIIVLACLAAVTLGMVMFGLMRRKVVKTQKPLDTNVSAAFQENPLYEEVRPHTNPLYVPQD